MNKIKKTIALIICLLIALGSFAFAEEAQLISAPSSDYEGHWAEVIIQKWLNSGKVAGYPDGSYKPDNNVTRAEFVKMVNGIINYNGKSKVTYSDVPTTEWFYSYISVAQDIGYISGYSDTKFGPNDYITREQAASILSRIQYLINNVSAINKYNDQDSISSWAKEAVGAASEAGFIKGYDDGSFKPQNKLTRAEAITMLDNVLVNAKNIVIYNDGNELKDTIVKGDLIIAKNVGNGDVQLSNLNVNGEIKVYGGGINSIYFNNVKVSKIAVEKDKVRLVFDDGTTVEEITVSNETILQNENGEITKVTVKGNGEVTFTGNFEEVVIEGNGDITLDNAVITKLAVNNQVLIQGTGTITTLAANANGIEYEAEVTIDKVTLGKGVTEEPVKKEEIVVGGGGGGGPIGPVDPIESYAIKITATSPDGITKFIITDEYSGNENITDFLVAECKKILENTVRYEDLINGYLGNINTRIDDITINGYDLNSEAGWINLSNYFDEIIMVNGKLLNHELYNVKIDEDTSVYDNEGYTLTNLKDILSLYESSKLEDYIYYLDLHFTSTDPDFHIGYPELLYNGETIGYRLTSGDVSFSGIENVMNYILANATEDIESFFNDSETITLEVSYGAKAATIKFAKELLK